MIRLINKPITYSRDAASRRGGRAGAGDEMYVRKFEYLYFFLHHSNFAYNWLDGQRQ